MNKYEDDPGEASNQLQQIRKEIALVLKSEQRMGIETEMEKLNKLKSSKGIAAVASSIKGSIIGKKKRPEVPVAIQHPKTKRLHL